jgi:hypothetical protein
MRIDPKRSIGLPLNKGIVGQSINYAFQSIQLRIRNLFQRSLLISQFDKEAQSTKLNNLGTSRGNKTFHFACGVNHGVPNPT